MQRNMTKLSNGWKNLRMDMNYTVIMQVCLI